MEIPRYNFLALNKEKPLKILLMFSSNSWWRQVMTPKIIIFKKFYFSIKITVQYKVVGNLFLLRNNPQCCIQHLLSSRINGLFCRPGKVQ